MLALRLLEPTVSYSMCSPTAYPYNILVIPIGIFVYLSTVIQASQIYASNSRAFVYGAISKLGLTLPCEAQPIE